MNTEAKHTRTPWLTGPLAGDHQHEIYDEGGKTIAVVYTDANDAAVICRAVNSNAALVAALEAVMACARGEIERPVTQRSGWPNAERLITAALASAREG